MSEPASDELRAAIDVLYDTFAQYKLASRLPGCDHCTSDDDHAAIYAAPLRRLRDAAGELGCTRAHVNGDALTRPARQRERAGNL